MDGDGGGWWRLLAMVVMWRGWVVFDDGGLWSLWPLVAVWVCGRSVFVAVGGRCGWSSLFAVWAVVVGRCVCWW